MKKLLVLAVVCIMSTPLVRAETSNVNVYGTINTSLESVKAGASETGKDYTSRLRMISNSTNFGVKGSEDLTSDLKGVFQIELDVRIPEGGLQGPLRNSMVGLQGNWGTLFIGKWDTPFKSANYFMEPFYGSGVGYLASIADIISGATALNGESFNLRKENTLNYWSPKFVGLSLNLMYSPKGTGATANDNLMSGSLNYSEGPINAAFAYETHKEYVAIGQRDTGIKVAAGYKLFDMTSLNVAWDQISQKPANEIVTKRTALLFSLIHKIDDFAVRAGYGIAGKIKTDNAEVANTGAKLLTFGGSYTLSKRTDLYAVFSKISNEEAAEYNYVIGAVGPGSPATLSAGFDPQSIGIGVRHTF